MRRGCPIGRLRDEMCVPGTGCAGRDVRPRAGMCVVVPQATTFPHRASRERSRESVLASLLLSARRVAERLSGGQTSANLVLGLDCTCVKGTGKRVPGTGCLGPCQARLTTARGRDVRAARVFKGRVNASRGRVVLTVHTGPTSNPRRTRSRGRAVVVASRGQAVCLSTYRLTRYPGTGCPC